MDPSLQRLRVPMPAGARILASGQLGDERLPLLMRLTPEARDLPLVAVALLPLAALALLGHRRSRLLPSAMVVASGALLVVIGSQLLPLANESLSARGLAGILRERRAAGDRVIAMKLVEGDLGQFLYYSGGTLEWVGRRPHEPIPCAYRCRSDPVAGRRLLHQGGHVFLMRRKDFERLGPSLGWVAPLGHGRVGSIEYVIARSSGREAVAR